MPAQADRASAVETTREVVRACEARRTADAIQGLEALREDLRGEPGVSPSALELIDLTLAALGASPPDAPAPDPPGQEKAGSESAIDPELEAAIPGLRACRPPRDRRRPRLLGKSPAIDGATPLESGAPATRELATARHLLARAHYGEARLAARNALASAPPGSRIALEAQQLLAVSTLQLGERSQARIEAQRTLAAAKAANASGPWIASARLFTQLGDPATTATELEAVAVAAELAGLDAELAEARAELALALGDADRALEQLHPLLLSGAKDPTSVARVHVAIGDAERMRGNFPAADAAYRRGLELRSAALGASHPETARAQNALGVLRADFGDWPGAHEAFEQAEDIFEAEFGEEHPETITLRANRTLAAWRYDRSEANADAYAREVDALAKSLGTGNPMVADSLRNLARLERSRNRLQRAVELLDAALVVQTEALHEAHPALGLTQLQRARALEAMGQAAPARLAAERALLLLSGARGDEHPHTARARAVLGRIRLRGGDDDAAWAEAARAARALARHLRRSFEVMPDRQRALLARDVEETTNILYSAGAGAPPREVYARATEHRDLVLRSIAESRRRSNESESESASAPGEGRRALRELRAEYVTLTLGSQRDADRARALAEEIDSLEARPARTANRRSERGDAAANTDALAAECAALGPSDALIEFASYDRVQAGSWKPPEASFLAWVVTPTAGAAGSCDFARVELGPAGPIETNAALFADAMRRLEDDQPEARAALTKHLLAPLVPQLAGHDRWWIVPDGALWGVPFAALPVPEGLLPENETDTDRYLIESITIGTLASVHELSPRARPASSDASLLQRPLLFGAPEFGPKSGGGNVILTGEGPCRVASFAPLPGAVREIGELARMMSDPVVVSGAEATKQRFVREIERRPGVVHLATHGFFAGASGCGNSDDVALADGEWSGNEAASATARANPLLLSGVVFAGANRGDALGGPGSGIMTAYELAGVDLSSTQLVVLSACDTGAGVHRRGQEVEGLRWGLRAAGARALLTSLWASNDFAARKIMGRFYAELAEAPSGFDRMRGAAALREAQLERVAGDKRLGKARPLLWANFTFSGPL